MSHRVRLYILWGVVILSTLITLWFDYTILFQKISLYSGRISEHRKEIQLLQSRMEFIPFFKNEERRVVYERTRLTKQASFSEGFEFLTYLEQVAKQTDNDITVNIQENPTLSVSVQLEGSFNSLLDFLLMVGQTETTVELGKVARSAGQDIQTDLFLIPTITKP